ncbi:ATP-dependent DNA helicase RecG [Thermocrinis sp.]|uniref:ATP-dependent DNA helicase RecG n=1 Tax=Thermocrinis sp. TaxID=2024383 RepID=UPI002FDD42D7
MENLEKAKKFIEELKQNNHLKLRRSFGVGLYLFNLLKDKLSQAHLELLKRFDAMPLPKKIAILDQIEQALKEEDAELQINFDHYPKKPLEKFFVEIDTLKALDPKEKKLLKSLGIEDLFSAFWFVPVRYEDRRLNTCIKTAIPGKAVALKVKVVDANYDPLENYPITVRCEDGTGYLTLKYKFKNKEVLFRFKKGMELIVFGKLMEYKQEKYMVHPEIIKEEEAGRILPFYNIRTKDSQSLSARTRHRKVRQAMQKLSEYIKYLPEYLPKELLEKHQLPKLPESLYFLHNPSQFSDRLNAFDTPAHHRLIYEDLLLFQLALQIKKLDIKSLRAVKLNFPEESLKEFLNALPFKLTQAQARVLEDIIRDVKIERPMNRLLQGDVGSGKTVVAMAVCYMFFKEGHQSAVMVPTEILAYQHYENFKKLLEPLGVKVGLLTSSVSPSQKRSLLRHVREGNIHVVIGTHALIQEKVEFKSLAFALVDEQHRFGVMQRKLLLEKSKNLFPHFLVMSATPIPRTLALSLYGDLDISIIDQMPYGRKPVITRLFFESEFEKVVKAVKVEIEKGHKAYVIYPLIDPSEKLELKSAVEEHKKWLSLFPGRKVLLLHGRLKDEEKKRVMEEFKSDGDILVSTTVVEVGVDVPNATVMVIESAHRFGLSQLHQLRGRVGRSDLQSYCLLVVPDSIRQDQESLRRLKVLVQTNDGFKIAEEDLKLRGPGELLGESQSGYFGFLIANIQRERDRHFLELCKQDAEEILRKDPELKEHQELKSVLLYRYSNKIDLSYIA